MNQFVTIKGYKDGLVIQMNNICSFEDILDGVAKSFEKSRGFFKDTSIAIALEGRWLSTEEERLLLQTIDEHSDINVICIMGQDEDTERRFVKAIKRVESQRDDNNARLYKGDVAEDEEIECEGSLIVLGDVMRGASISASHDIIVIGTIYGSAFAGVHDRGEHFVAATDFQAQKIKVNDMIYHPAKEKGLFGKKNKNNLKMVHIKNGVLTIDEVSGDIIKDVTSV